MYYMFTALYNFTVNATYLFEYFALHVSTTEGHLQVLQTTYKITEICTQFVAPDDDPLWLKHVR
jgi:hypothetical protein